MTNVGLPDMLGAEFFGPRHPVPFMFSHSDNLIVEAYCAIVYPQSGAICQGWVSRRALELCAPMWRRNRLFNARTLLMECGRHR